jgi:hypothetical protein
MERERIVRVAEERVLRHEAAGAGVVPAGAEVVEAEVGVEVLGFVEIVGRGGAGAGGSVINVQ